MFILSFSSRILFSFLCRSVVSSPPALGYGGVSAGDPPEPDVKEDCSRSDAGSLVAYSSSDESLEKSSKKTPVTEKHADVDDLLEESFDQDGQSQR